MLESHGADFDDFDNVFGSVSSSLDDPIYLNDFSGPALPASDISLAPVRGESLADRLACYGDELAVPLARYVKWHVGCDADQLHASAAVPLAINRVFPTGVDVDALACAKQSDSLADDLFGIPRAAWNYSSNVQASLPVGGFAALFRQCHAALDAIGVRIHERTPANPKKFLAEASPNDVHVWAASPMPLFRTVGMTPPKAPARRFATYIFEVQWTGAVPFYVQNFTAEGSCFRAYIYESQGKILLTAECVFEDDGETLKADIYRMLAGFDGDLSIGDQLYRTVKPRWLYHSTDTIDKLGALRTALKAKMGESFVTGAWEAYAKGEKFAQVGSDLEKALETQMALETL